MVARAAGRQPGAWDGTRWVLDDTLHTFDRVRGLCREMSAKASAQMVAAVERLARADRRLAKNNTILTNRHVVGNERQVTVVFKPSDPSGKPKDDEVVRADVIKLDVQRDLALLRPASIPSRRPLDISAEDSVDVGTDVDAESTCVAK